MDTAGSVSLGSLDPALFRQMEAKVLELQFSSSYMNMFHFTAFGAAPRCVLAHCQHILSFPHSRDNVGNWLKNFWSTFTRVLFPAVSLKALNVLGRHSTACFSLCHSYRPRRSLVKCTLLHVVNSVTFSWNVLWIQTRSKRAEPKVIKKRKKKEM